MPDYTRKTKMDINRLYKINYKKLALVLFVVKATALKQQMSKFHLKFNAHRS